MLVVINMTGLNRVYWLPTFEGQSDCDGLWYFEAKWLFVEFSVHSKAMGCEMIRRFSRSLERSQTE